MQGELITQRTSAPTRKWSAERIAGAAVVIIVWGAELWGVDVPGTVAGALTLIIGGAISYAVRDRI